MHLDRPQDVHARLSQPTQLSLFSSPAPETKIKYFVAHLLSGDVAAYHEQLTRTLFEQYHVTPLHNKVRPHLTIKIPFYANAYEINQVEERLEAFAARVTPPSLTFNRFGRFGFKTVYMDVVKSRDATLMVRDCVSELNAIPWMQRIPHEGNKLHASVARFLTYKQFRRVWRHVSAEQAQFKQALDTLAILKKEHARAPWRLHKTFSLTGAVYAETPYHAAPECMPELVLAT